VKTGEKYLQPGIWIAVKLRNSKLVSKQSNKRIASHSRNTELGGKDLMIVQTSRYSKSIRRDLSEQRVKHHEPQNHLLAETKKNRGV